MRQLKTFDQLRALMAREAEQHAHLRGLQPRLRALPERDASGCNWAVEGWATAQGTAHAPCAQLQALVAACQAQFNAVGRSPANATAVLLLPVVVQAVQAVQEPRVQPPGPARRSSTTVLAGPGLGLR